ncbi:MAG: hypothetical protein FWE37_08550 [Spirochaetaceae bacterium]|nr:hypothetical protein [Spirochaetaceae bacterium]
MKKILLLVSLWLFACGINEEASQQLIDHMSFIENELEALIESGVIEHIINNEQEQLSEGFVALNDVLPEQLAQLNATLTGVWIDINSEQVLVDYFMPAGEVTFYDTTIEWHRQFTRAAAPAYIIDIGRGFIAIQLLFEVSGYKINAVKNIDNGYIFMADFYLGNSVVDSDNFIEITILADNLIGITSPNNGRWRRATLPHYRRVASPAGSGRAGDSAELNRRFNVMMELDLD